MEAAKLKSPPLVTAMPFGDDVLNLTLDRDIVTQDFLMQMDRSARRIFTNQLAGVRKILQSRGLVPAPDADKKTAARPTRVSPRSRKGNRKSKETIQSEAMQKVTDEALRLVEAQIPSEEESVPLAQAQEMAYMAETLARVILAWDLEDNGKPIAIVQRCRQDKCEHEEKCCAEQPASCRHPSRFVRSMSQPVMTRLFQFCCFEAHDSSTKKNETQ